MPESWQAIARSQAWSRSSLTSWKRWGHTRVRGVEQSLPSTPLLLDLHCTRVYTKAILNTNKYLTSCTNKRNGISPALQQVHHLYQTGKILIKINTLIFIKAITITLFLNRDITSSPSGDHRPSLSTDASLDENISTLQHQVTPIAKCDH